MVSNRLRVLKCYIFFQNFLAYVLGFWVVFHCHLKEMWWFWASLLSFTIKFCLVVYWTMLGLHNFSNLEKFFNLQVYSIMHVFMTPLSKCWHLVKTVAALLRYVFWSQNIPIFALFCGFCWFLIEQDCRLQNSSFSTA